MAEISPPNVTESANVPTPNTLNLRAINPLLSRTNFASKLLDELDSAATLVYNILQSDEELSKRARDLAFVEQLKAIVNSTESPDLIMVRLYALIAQIKPYDEKIAAIIVDYLRNRKSIGKILGFIYYNLSPERLRTLYANIKVAIERVQKIEDKEIRKPVLDRLLLMDRVFERIRVLEDGQLIDEQKRRLWGMIQRIDRGMKDGSWEGFLGKYGVASDTEYYINSFAKYHNKELIDMLKRKKERYGETKPEEWLGDERTPDTLWYIYTHLDKVIAQRLTILWQNAQRIAQSLKPVLENLLGKNPSTALEKIKRRLELLEGRIRGAWKKRKGKALELLIAARIESEKALKVIVAIQERFRSFFGQRAVYLSNVYKSERVLTGNTKVLTSKEKPDFTILGYLLLSTRLYENDLADEARIAKSLETTPAIDEKVESDFSELITSTLDAYQKFLDFIDALELNIQTDQFREKINILRGGSRG